MCRSRFVAAGYTPCMNDYVEKRNFIRDSPELQNQVQFVFACDKVGRSKKLQN